VAVEGHNTTGKKMVAEKIIDGAAHQPQETATAEILKFHHHSSFQDGEPIRILVAAGPFTTSNNMEYEPWDDLMVVIVKENPDVVILTGPFVDMRHKGVSTGDVTLPFEDGTESYVPYDAFFATKISALIEEVYSTNENCTIQFVFVPHLHDANADMV
jgi:DNA polymerase alpha subunit B